MEDTGCWAIRHNNEITSRKEKKGNNIVQRTILTQHEENHENVRKFHKRVRYPRGTNISTLHREVRSAKIELKHGKSAGDDGILNEYLRLGV